MTIPSENNEVIILPPESSVTQQHIKDMISLLSQTEDGEPLKDAMSKLKQALKENPVACAMLLPEEIGECVHHLMRVTGRDLEMQASGKKKEKKVTFDFSDEKALKELEDDLF